MLRSCLLRFHWKLNVYNFVKAKTGTFQMVSTIRIMTVFKKKVQLCLYLKNFCECIIKDIINKEKFNQILLSPRVNNKSFHLILKSRGNTRAMLALNEWHFKAWFVLNTSTIMSQFIIYVPNAQDQEKQQLKNLFTRTSL